MAIYRSHVLALFFTLLVVAGLTAIGCGGNSHSQNGACNIVTSPDSLGEAAIGAPENPPHVVLIGLNISSECHTSGVSYVIRNPDNTDNTYDIGLYCDSGQCVPGQLYVHLGATPGTVFAPTTGPFSLHWTGQTPVTLPVGLYALGLGTSCTATINANHVCAFTTGDQLNGLTLPFSTNNTGVYSNGLPPTIVPPAVNPTSGAPKMPALTIW